MVSNHRKSRYIPVPNAACRKTTFFNTLPGLGPDRGIGICRCRRHLRAGRGNLRPASARRLTDSPGRDFCQIRPCPDRTAAANTCENRSLPATRRGPANGHTCANIMIDRGCDRSGGVLWSPGRRIRETGQDNESRRGFAMELMSGSASPITVKVRSGTKTAKDWCFPVEH